MINRSPSYSSDMEAFESVSTQDRMNNGGPPGGPSGSSASFHSTASPPSAARRRKRPHLGLDQDSSSGGSAGSDNGYEDSESGRRSKRAKRSSKGKTPVLAPWSGEPGKEHVKLISKDGVEFVRPKYLIQASSVQLRELLEEGSLDPMESVTGIITAFDISILGTIIHIDTHSTVLSDYLLLASHTPHSLSLDRLKRVYPLSKSLDSPVILQAISHAVHSRLARSSPWLAFLFSAEMGDIQAAKACLRQMAYDKQHRDLDLKDLYPGMLDGLDIKWMCALVRSLSIHPHSDVHEVLGVNAKKWDLISEDFKL